MIYEMIHRILREGESLNGYGLISLLMFFLFFAGVLLWTFGLKKNYLSRMSTLPLDGGERPQPPTDNIPS